jgi:hypothetical protein
VTFERSVHDHGGPSATEVALGFAAAVLVGTVVVLLRQELLPLKFSYDGLRIQAIAARRVGDRGDASYGNVGDFYAVTGLSDSALLAGLVGFGLFVACLWLALRRSGFGLTWLSLGLLGVAALLGAVFLGWYSKDVLIVPITALAIRADRRSRLVVLVAAMLLYATLFRSYWAAVALVFLLFVVVLRRSRSRPLAVLTALVVLGVLLAGWGFELLTGADVGSLRTSLNAERLGSVDAVSQIGAFVDGGHPLEEALNLIVTAGVLLFPLPLLFLGGIYYVAVFTLIAGLWLLFLRGSVSLMRGAGNSDPVSRDALWHAVLIAYPLAFLTIQVLFEPDYGSALRHLSPLLPCMLLVVALAGRLRQTDEPERRAAMAGGGES